MGGVFQALSIQTGAAQQQVFQQHGRLAQSDLNSLALNGSNFALATQIGPSGSKNADQALQALQNGEGIDVQGPDGQHHVVTSLAQLQKLTNQDRAENGGFYGGLPPQWPQGCDGYQPFQPGRPHHHHYFQAA